LIDGLTLGRQDARERAGHLLKENPATERRRRVLSQDLERFEAARLDLQNIPGIQLAGLDEIDEGGEDDIRNDTSDNHVQSGTPQETLIVAREEVMEHTEEIQWRPAIVPTDVNTPSRAVLQTRGSITARTDLNLLEPHLFRSVGLGLSPRRYAGGKIHAGQTVDTAVKIVEDIEENLGNNARHQLWACAPVYPRFRSDKTIFRLDQQMDLPQIAVVGSQSVGKSSLIESVSGITLPRASGTCTRCPIECRLSKSDSSWSCDVYLRVVGQHMDTQFGPTITDKAEVQERIRRAQQAILNPSTPTIDLLRTQPLDIEKNEHSFSKNLISVRISGRDVDDLTFVDLPGVIASVGPGGRESDIEEVRNLVMSFITKKSCLILLVVSCETDIENQGARQLAKKVDPSGDRTIPVLTKPDRIAAAEHKTWIHLLSNEHEIFKHGWFCVKQSNQEQLDNGITWAKARQKEMEFFETQLPWSGLEAGIRSRLGTAALTQALGSILFGLIRKSLPAMFPVIQKKLQMTKAAIARLPRKMQGDPVGILWKLVGDFQKDVTQLVVGQADDGSQGLMQLFRRYRIQFHDTIFGQTPHFVPHPTPKDSLLYSYYKDNEAGRDILKRFKQGSATFIFLDQVKEDALNAITRELPGNYPYAIKQKYIAHFTANWLQPAQVFFGAVERQFSRRLKTLIANHFGSHRAGGLEKAVLDIILVKLKECSICTQEKMVECLALEHQEPMTCNGSSLSHHKARYLAQYKAEYIRGGHLEQNSNDFHNSTYMQAVLDNLGRLSIKIDRNDVFLKILSSTEPSAAVSEAAMDIMAEVFAYYHVAFKRYVDRISQIIDTNLLKGLVQTIDDALVTGLSPENQNMRELAGNFLKDDPQIETSRKALSEDLKRFEGARLALESIPGAHLSILEDDDGDEAGNRRGAPDGHDSEWRETLI
ncbi:hypothetical protein FRC17_001407, partial [Serendipita sp. 399]